MSRRLPRWLLWIVVVCLALAALLVLRTVTVSVLARAHYGSTPDFDTFVAERTVPANFIETWLPDGDTLARDEVFTLGEFDADGAEIPKGHSSPRITHGKEVLLETTVTFEVDVDPEMEERSGIRFPVPEIRTRDGMRAIVQVGLLGMEGLGEPDGGYIIIDAVLAAGAGTDEFRVVRLADRPSGLVPTMEPPLTHRVLGLVHPPGDLPEEGLVYQLRSSLAMTPVSAGFGLFGLPPNGMRTNCDEYSFHMTVEARETPLGISGESTWSKVYTVEDRVW